ncbi:MAG TPA: gluconate:H+ symporter [Verrucomicrobiales bacterium]|jgi:GntP family gluconate:H+ symporter|nr:gluconate:H+ symporter [Verrucomicrobiales bacterium]
MTWDDTKLILLAVAAIGALVLLITWLKVNPFIALLASALLLGAGAGLNMLEVLKSFQTGLGNTLGGTAGIIGLGVMLGKLLAESGGAEVMAKRFNAFFGPSRAGWCIMALAIAIGLTTWFAVGLLLLLPILLTLTHETKRPFLLLAIPLLSCLSVMHGLMPPHPGPVIAVEKLKASAGMVLVWGFVIGLPTAAIAGPIFARWAVKRVTASPPDVPVRVYDGVQCAPAFGITLFTMLLPVALMLCATVAELVLPKENPVRTAVSFIGHPTIALAVSVVLAMWSLGTRCGHGKGKLLKFTEESVATIGMTLLVVGGGGGFAAVLRDGGVATSLGHMAQTLHLPPLVFGWMVAAFIRVATGSATVSITAAAGVLAPLLSTMPGVNVELLVIAVGCGSLFLSHLNDGGFWIVKDCLGLTVGQTLRTWTVTETIVGIAGLLLTLVADFVLRLF